MFRAWRLNCGHACASRRVDEAGSGVKPPAGKGVVGMLSWHGSHFWVCITICRVRHGDSVTKPDYYYYYIGYTIVKPDNISFLLTDRNQLTPLHFAKHWNLRDLGKLLILAICDVHAATRDRITPLRLGNENMTMHLWIWCCRSISMPHEKPASRDTRTRTPKARVEELKRAPGTLLSLARCAVRGCRYVKVGDFERNVAALELPQHLKDDLIFKIML